MLVRPLVVACLTVALAAQEPPADPFGHSRHGAEFDEGPRTAATRMAGLSVQVHFPVAGLDAESQQLFDQGICQQHGFWYFEAERSFRQVAMRHPDCAMAYWGLAMANVENTTRAAGFAAQAVQRAVGLPQREQLYVDAIAALYQIDAPRRTELQSGDAARIAACKQAIVAAKDRDESKLRRAFLKGLEAVVAACPDDLEAKAFLAIQSWRNADYDLPISSHGAVDALLELVFQQAPLHPAHHYRVHLWDREQAERALRSAAVLGDTAPAIAHQWHMAGHIYAKLDRHAEAAWQQEASARVDHAHMQRERVMPFLIHNYGHNQEWLARSLSYLGRPVAALAVAKNLAELPRHPKFNQVAVGDDIAGYARARLVSVCEDHELWTEAVALCREGFLERSDDVKSEVQRLGLLGRGLFRLGRADEGKLVLDEVEGLLGKARAARAAALDRAEGEAFGKREPETKALEAMAEAGREPTATVRAVLDLQRELRGEQLLAAGDAKAALAEFTAVADFPKTLLADAHLAAGDVDKAIELLESEAKERPRRVPTVGRLVRAYDASPKPEHAARRDELRMQLPFATGVEPRSVFAVASTAQVHGRVPELPPAAPADQPAAAPSETAGFPADFGVRPPLGSLGPLAWTPGPHPGLELPRVDDGTFVLPKQPGRPTVVVFYLGFGCLQCKEQLHALAAEHAAYTAAGIEVVAVGDEAVSIAAAAVAELPAERRFPFPLLADPTRASFRQWRCFDDFEGMPLHGTFLVDGDGRVRWQDIGAEPFADVKWLLAESQRLLALPAQSAGR